MQTRLTDSDSKRNTHINASISPEFAQDVTLDLKEFMAERGILSGKNAYDSNINVVVGRYFHFLC